MEKLLERYVQSTTGLTLKGGWVLGLDGQLSDAALHMDAGVISETASAAAQVIDVSDCLILPGIIDAHGDGHEHHLQPRVGADFPERVALRNVDLELIATRRSSNAVGATIAEFPLTLAAAQTARDLGNPIVMGAPNALRGLSTSGNVSA